MIVTRAASIAAVVACALTACGKGGEGSVRMSLAAVNSSATAGTVSGLVRATRSVVATPQVTSGSILSGAPDEMRIYVQQVLLSSKDTVEIFKSSDPRGSLVTLTNQTIDLAQALGVSQLAVPAGTYSELRLVVSRVAEIAGCVTGSFQPFVPFVATTGPLQPEILAVAPLHTGNVYSNDPILDTAARTFCTHTARSELSVGTYTTSAIGSNADFMASLAQLTEIDLDRGNPGNLDAAQLRAGSVTVATQLPFEVKDKQETKLLLAVDLNRMLRYFANTRNDLQPPAPTMKAGTSYFFTSVFLDSLALAPGDAAAIEGYAVNITVDQHNGGSPFLVSEWMTVIRGSDGNVLAGVIIADDDDAYTIAKGNLDPAASGETAPGVWRIGFKLGTLGSGSLDGFAFTALGGSGTCNLTPLHYASVSAGTTFQVSYTRKL